MLAHKLNIGTDEFGFGTSVVISNVFIIIANHVCTLALSTFVSGEW